MRKSIIAIILVLGVIIGVTVDRAMNRVPKEAISGDTPAGPVKTGDKEQADPAGTAHTPAAGFNQDYVSSEQVAMGTVPELLPVTGKLAFSAEQLHLVSARVSGRLDRILVFEGARVKKGQALAELYSPDFLSAENEYLLAKNTVRTLKEAANPDLLNDAKVTEQSAINKLQVLGANEEDIERLSSSGAASTHLIIRAPIPGMVVKRNMDPGAFLNIGDNFMSIVDTGRLWFYGNIYEQDYSRVRLGQELQLQAAALPGKQFSGRVSFISPGIDPVTHTLSVRCDIPNPDGKLRPEIFVTADLFAGKRKAVIIPRTAFIQIKDAGYVVVEEKGGLYRRVAVTTMNLKDSRVAVLSGLKGGEHVVVKGAVLINNMITK